MKWKKIQIVWLPIALFLLQDVIGKGAKSILSAFSLNEESPRGQHIEWAIMIFVGIVYTVNHFTTNSRFFNKFQNAENMMLKHIEDKTEQVIKSFSGREGISANIMILSKRRICLDEPQKINKKRRKPSWTYRLKPFYNSPISQSAGARNLKFTVNQGVCGQAVREEKTTYFDLDEHGTTEYNLTEKQLHHTEHIQSIVSTPLWEYDYQTHRSKGNIIGVVNIDCTTDYIRNVVANEKDWIDLKQKVETLAYSCSQFI